MTSAVLSPVRFDAPLVNPAPNGLYLAAQWTDAGEGEPLRWLPSGVEIRPWNYEGAFGVWAAAWNATSDDLGEDDVKQGSRPTGLDSFAAVTIWAADECDATAPSRDEVRTRAAQTLRLMEQNAVEAEFAARLLDDAGTPDSATDLVGAVSALDDAFAKTNTLGFIHARPGWMAVAAQANLLVRGGVGLKTPSGHTWVFGGGYVDGLGDALVATSQPFGWRGPTAVRMAVDPAQGRFHAIAERSLVVGYEALVGAVEVVAAVSP